MAENSLFPSTLDYREARGALKAMAAKDTDVVTLAA